MREDGTGRGHDILTHLGIPLDGSVTPSSLIRVCRLAEGGMGRVDLAVRHEGTFRRLVAIKRLHPHLASDPDFRSMFLEEARIAGWIRHPNVVGVLDVGEDARGPYLVMDYVDGLPLGNLIRLARAAGEPMPVQVCVRIALDVARGLHAAHEQHAGGRPLQIVHRDLSPQNVLVGFDGASRVTDFGIAKALGRGTRTTTGVLKGKMSYMAPEQLRFEELDRRCDLFALGVITFEMLSGTAETAGMDAAARTQHILQGAPPDIGEVRADVPDELVRLLFELHAKNRAARPSDAREVVHRLEGILATILVEDERVDVDDYVAVVAAEVRQEQDRVIQEALAAVPRPADPARAPTPRLWPAAVVALLIFALGGALAAIAWRGESASRVVAPAASPRPLAPADLTSTPSPEPTASPASDPAAAEPAAAEPTVGEPADTPRSRPARRRGRAKVPRDDHGRLPDWVDFER